MLTVRPGTATYTSSDIPEELMNKPRRITGAGTKPNTVRNARQLLVRQQQQRDAIAWLAEHEPFLSEDEIAEESNRRPSQ